MEVKYVEDLQKVFYETWLDTYPNEKVGILKEDIEEHFKNALAPERIQKIKDFIISKKGATDLLNIIAIDIKTDKVVGTGSFAKKESEYKVQSLYVLTEYQGKGIGKALMQEGLSFLKDESENSKNIIVHLATYNENAKKFYEGFGFVDTGERFEEERHRMPISQKMIPEMRMKKVK